MGNPVDGASPSDETLLFLFADEVVERSSIVSRLGMEPAWQVPGTDRLVELCSLEQFLVVWALWGLHDRGHIGLELIARAGRLEKLRERVVGTGQVEARVVVTVDTAADPGDSLGAELVAGAMDGGRSVYSLVLEWVVDRASATVDGLVGALHADAARLGLVEEDTREQGPWRRRSCNRVLPASQARSGVLERSRPMFEGRKRSWEAFCSADADLYDGLVHDVSKALANGRPMPAAMPAPAPGS